MIHRLKWNGLRNKIIAWSFVPTAIILGAVAFFTYSAYQQVTEDLVVQRNTELSRLAANQLSFELAKYADTLTTETRASNLQDANPTVRQTALEYARNRLSIFDAGVVLLNTRGIVVASYPEREAIHLQDWSRQPFFREMLHYPSPYYTDILPIGPDGTNVIGVAVPLIGEFSEFDGVLLGMFELGATSISALYGDIVKLRVETTCCAILVDSNGGIIYHSLLERIGQNISDQVPVERALSGEIGTTRTLDTEGQVSIASYAPVPGTGWAVITEESWADLITTGMGYRRFLGLLLAMGVIIPGLVVAIGVRRITKPLDDLNRAAERVATGDFNQTIVANTGDEIETLAKQFNLMAARLQASYANLEQRVEERTRELAALNTIADVVSRSLDLNEILNDALIRVLEVLNLDAGGIYLLEQDGGMLSLAAHSGISDDFAEEINPLDVEQSFYEYIATSGKPIVVPDLTIEPELDIYTRDWRGFHTVAIVPMTVRAKTFGALFVMNRTQRDFTEQDLDLIQSIARQIAVATENARLFRGEQRRADHFRVIAETGRQILGILNADELMREIAQLVYDTFDYYLVTIGMVEDGMVVFKAGKKEGWPEDQFRPKSLAITGEGITAWVAAHGETLLAPDVSQEPRYLLWPDADETHAELAIPLNTKAGVIGVLNVESKAINGIEDNDVVVLQSIAQQAAIAIENAQLFEQAQQLAVIQERQRLARDLHDSVTQALYGVTLYAEATARQISREQPNLSLARDHLDDLRVTAQEALREMRLLIFELRPSVLEKEGLLAALQTRLESVEGRSGITASFDAPPAFTPLPPKTESSLYWIAQEVLNNTLKHAQAHNITLTLRQDHACATLEIADDGIGFDMQDASHKGGLGLPGLHERAAEIGGQLTIESKPGQGTLVRIEVPQQ